MAKAQRKSQGSKKAAPAKRAAKKQAPAPKQAKFVKKINMFKNQIDYFSLDAKYAKMGLSTRAIHSGN